ncbi:uncharacterized protein LOC123476927 [Daphnia magna]|uniref:uncharacterized protein LOC123476927 n=1 Tax=Daphnia magna TaxID=35525 RepID=UPI001E1BCC9D|nr:uncharacterized protein LOC123476927 [Daphnia magna]
MDLYKYLVEIGFIDISVSSYCLQCSGQLTLISSTTVIDGCQLKCNNRIGVNGSTIKTKLCSKKFTIRRYSWFHKSHLTIHEILTLTYYWWSEISQKYGENDLDLAHGTTIDWNNFCREVSEHVVINNSEKIGGFGITVEIDESKFGKSNLLDAVMILVIVI